jgi:phosphomannomutase
MDRMPGESMEEPDPRVLALAWLAVDPDAAARQATRALLDGDGSELTRLFGRRLAFGTAGLRGPMGPGPASMNRVLVRVVAAALAQVILDHQGIIDHQGPDDPHVVVGFDARHGSRAFANDTARVLAARGIRCTLFADVVPTPLLAFSVKHLGASAGVMVTASHNPRQDNGYKVYWRGGTQLIEPIDSAIADVMMRTPLLRDDDLAAADDSAIAVAADSLVEAYLDAITGLLRPTHSGSVDSGSAHSGSVDSGIVDSRLAGSGDRTLTVAYTPLHGVGGDTLRRAFERAGFDLPAVVGSQADPDPDFPTAPFPNPEETGVVEPLLALASSISADVALANDPDADRLAVAVPNGASWRLLTGDELGSLLAEHLLSRPAPPDVDRLVVNTVVSSRLLAKIAASHGAQYEETLTGFKWIMQAANDYPAAQPVLGYEEALGYSVGDAVSDKDGISAALIVMEMVADLRQSGRTLLDSLDELHRAHGVHVTGQRSIRFESVDQGVPPMTAAMEVLRQRPPTSLGGEEVEAMIDLAQPGGRLPTTDGLVFETETARVVVRPSGTEPKMKVYGEVVLAAGEDLPGQRERARSHLIDVLNDAVLISASPERSGPAFSTPPPQQVAQMRASSAGVEPLATIANALELAVQLRSVVRNIELSCPEGNDAPGTVRALCSQARRPDPADPTVGPAGAVLVSPEMVALATELTAGSSIQVKTSGVDAGGPATAGLLDEVLVRLAAAEERLRIEAAHP